VRTVLVVGIGAGDPDYLTIQAIKALNRADILFVVDKGQEKDELVRLRTTICDRFIEKTGEHAEYRIVEIADPERDRTASAYRSAVTAWRRERADRYETALRDELGEDGCGAFLVWGDPSLYDSTIAILDEIIARGSLELAYEVIPGISSVQALAASHRIALNRIGGPIHITTGRAIADGLPPDAESTVVMLDGDPRFDHLDPDLTIYWGAYLGTANEIILAGRLGTVAGEIRRMRAEARIRHGWIMDTYLLRGPDRR
jgi:precorrin-6A synthase